MNNWICILLLASGGVTGCNVAGPTAVQTGRSTYNMAIQQTTDEQLLLNLVRLKYRDTPFFLGVASVSTSYDLSTSASGSVSLPESRDNSYGLDARVGYAEKPTVTYLPLQGEQFVTQLMSPIDIKTIVLLYYSGWSIERIFLVTLQSINGLGNSPSASGPTPEQPPEFEQFQELADLLRAMQIEGWLHLGVRKAENDEITIEIQFSDEAAHSVAGARLYELLGLDIANRQFPLTRTVWTGDRDRIAIVPRSLLSTLFYISQAVDVPSGDEQAGRVTVTRGVDGTRFDWHRVFGDLIRIRSSTFPPKNAYVAISYRGSWFYLDDSDLTAKSTFLLLQQLFALQAGEIKSAGPILTLPVNR